MTLEEFEAERAERPCKSCGALGVDLRTNENNGGLYVWCPSCGQAHAWIGVQFLKQSNTKKRDPYPDGCSVDEVWARWGNHCVVCNLDRPALEILHIGRQRHHTKLYADHGHDGGLILPICGRCHALVTAIQMLVRQFMQFIAEQKDDAA